MKYNIAKGWIAEIITAYYNTGDPRFKDKEYRDAFTMVINDYHMKLKYEEHKKEMPKEMKDWIIQNYKDCEEDKLTEDQRTKFLDLVEENKEDKDFQDAFKEFQKSKK